MVYNFGSINIDLVYRVPHLVRAGETLASRSLQTVLGGKGANQSVALARAGVEVAHIGKIGNADVWARDQMNEAGVDVSTVTCVEGASGHAIIQVDDAGENSIILHGGANQSFDKKQLGDSLRSAQAGDWLLMQNECSALEEAFAIAGKMGLRLAFNPAPMTQRVLDLPLDQCELLIVNETEAMALSGTDDVEATLQSLGKRYPATRLVLTLGGKGALVQWGDTRFSADALKVSAVDTTGAGDTFVGFYLAALIAGLDDQAALHRACAAAALAVTRQGATPGIPTARQVDEFISQPHHAG